MRSVRFNRVKITPERVAELAQDHDAKEIADIFGADVSEIVKLMPRSTTLRYELVNMSATSLHAKGERWPVHSRRKGYLMAQIKGLVAHEVVKAGQ
tara:strand:- start:33898 stop:34185 length:288 start_codon:yes stop_codon:yes gene_type:complete